MVYIEIHSFTSSFLYPFGPKILASFDPSPLIRSRTPPSVAKPPERRRYLAGGPGYWARQVLSDGGTSELLTGPQVGPTTDTDVVVPADTPPKTNMEPENDGF